MNAYIKKRNQKLGEKTVEALKKRHFDAYYFIDNIKQRQLIAVLKVRLNSLNLIQ